MLAFSLAVSMNGMTVLAAGTEEAEATVVSVMEVTADNTQQDADESAEDSQSAESSSGEEQADSGQQVAGQTDPSETGTDSETEDSGTGSQTDGDAADGTEAESGEEVSDSEETPLEDETAESEEAAAEEVAEETEDESAAEEKTETAVVRMVSFTDETGLRVTYDANQTLKYTVEDGVLTKVEVVSNTNDLTSDGTTAISGAVVLSQPGDDDEYGSFTSISADVFAGNTSITYVKIPSGVTTLAEGAFQGCTALKGVYLPSTVTEIPKSAFEGCTKLTQLALPKTVTSIGERAFYGDSKLFMVYMKDADYSKLATIGASAFYECTALEEFCSDTDFVLPSSLSAIGESAFYGCKSIASVDMNESVSSLGAYAFQNCTSLTNVSFSSALETIADYAFAGCTKLVGVTFKTGNTTIGEYAFSGCYHLGGIELPYSVATIGQYAFQSCSNLVSVEIPNGNIDIKTGAFPNISTLTLIGYDGSNVYQYTVGKEIKFVSYKNYNSSYYTYTTQTLGSGSGTLLVKDASGKDPNTLNSKQGVAYGTTLYVYYTPASGSALVDGTVKCNGTALEKDSSGKYFFTMPIGGALITAEFANTSSSTRVTGLEDDISVEVSNGEVTTNSNDEITAVGLKIGQYSRIFLTDAADSNQTVATSKISFTSGSTKVATITSAGVVHALSEGTAKITATLTGGDGSTIIKELRVIVTSAEVESLLLKASSYDASYITLTTSTTDSVQTATADKNAMQTALTLRLKATAYDETGDDMSVALKWATSDSSIAQLSSTSTTASSPINTVTIPAGASGEATITVTATKTDKTTVTQSFIVSVKDYTPRLVSSALTVNPNQSDGAILEIVGAYGVGVTTSSAKLKDADNSKVTSDFTLSYLSSENSASDKIYKFSVKPNTGVSDGKYSLNVNVDANDATYSLPITITVKTSTPNPKVAIASKQEKLNLFYKYNNTEVVVNVTNLGTAEVAASGGYSLEALSTSDDDQLFTENFQVTYVSGSSCKITQKSTELKYTSKGKPAVTGYLVLQFEGYQSTVQKKYKITIPTQTVTPSYTLSRTSDTYYTGCAAQTVTLQLLDKKNKNAVVEFGEDSGYTVSIKSSSTTSAISEAKLVTDETEGSVIQLTMKKNPSAGKVYLEIGNTAWANGKTFTYTYTIKTSSSVPTISLTSSSVTLNPSYPEQTVTFGLKSNQSDTVINAAQTFSANTNAKTKDSVKAEYEKLSVTYDKGVGTVSIKDSSIANGTYKFTCTVQYTYNNATQYANTVTLTVKVSKGIPSLTVKGTAALNTKATTGDSYAETVGLTMTTKNLPEDYTYDTTQMLSSITCTTKNCGSYAERFQWGIDSEENLLTVSLTEWCPAGTYSFSVRPVYTNATESTETQEEETAAAASVTTADAAEGGTAAASTSTTNTVTGKAITVKVKVYAGDIKVSLTAKGKLNLLERYGGSEEDEDGTDGDFTFTTSNSIMYTPKFTNLKDQVSEAKVFDADGAMPTYNGTESSLFQVTVSDGVLYVTPKEDAELENNKTYQIKIWMKLTDYTGFDDADGNGIWSDVLKVKTAQTLPKVTTDESTVNLYLSNKSYKASFVVDKQEVKSVKPAGTIESIAFDEDDTKANGSFTIASETQDDGSLKVTLKLNDTVSYSNNSTNKITMYVNFKGQGTNTAGTKITMNVKVNK